MRYLIEFRSAFVADLEVSPRKRLERLRIQKGARMYARVQPYVIETPKGPIEVADLHFDDGTVAREVRFERFQFAE